MNTKNYRDKKFRQEIQHHPPARWLYRPARCLDECLEDVRKLMDSDFVGPVNIGSGRDGYHKPISQNGYGNRK